MSGYADIYVIKKTRSKALVLSFLNHFAPHREESASEYYVALDDLKEGVVFYDVFDLMTFLELNNQIYQSIYWRNLQEKNPNKHIMVFYTADGCTIFGISRNYASVNDTRSQEECLKLMTDFLTTSEGYITYECPPESTYPEFMKYLQRSTKRFHLQTGQSGYPQPASNFEYQQITYKPESGCKTCAIGYEQHQPFRFKSEPRSKNRQFIGLNWVFDQIFVRDVVKTEFEKQQITGVQFSRPLLHKTGEPLATIYQLHIETLLAPALIENHLTQEVCEFPKDPQLVSFLMANDSNLTRGPYCYKTKYNFPHKRPMVFDASAFDNTPDFVRTSEWCGSGGMACRPILVSEKVKEIITNNQWKGAFLTEVELLNQ